MTRPLEDRFPNLYDEIVDERDPATGKIEQKRTPRANPPSARDVISRVLSAHGVHDSGITSDIVSSLETFFGEKAPEVERALEEEE